MDNPAAPGTAMSEVVSTINIVTTEMMSKSFSITEIRLFKKTFSDMSVLLFSKLATTSFVSFLMSQVPMIYVTMASKSFGP